MLTAIANTVWVVGIVAWYAIRYPFERRARKLRVVGHARSTTERAGLAVATVGLGVVPAVYVATGFPAVASYPPQAWMVAAGAAVYAGALWLFRRSHRDLGRNWSITLEIRERHRLVTEGVYRRIRHPMYAAFWLMALGQALLLANWLVAAAGFIGVAVLFFLRVGREEQMMLDTFGDEYRRYMDRTKRIIPRLY